MFIKWKQEIFEYPLQLQSVNNKIWGKYIWNIILLTIINCNILLTTKQDSSKDLFATTVYSVSNSDATNQLSDDLTKSIK